MDGFQALCNYRPTATTSKPTAGLGPNLAEPTYTASSVKSCWTRTRAPEKLPAKHYVYGETGLAHGGQIRPHRTHQAGLSVDFMVPVLDNANRSVPLPSTPMNKFG